ncbi:CYTH domain-containing protein [Candidatus Peregrinibacteria bacterium]|nr:CYTH domain-containing protein [Candidatus Peregrinibacteria bacterium]
MAIEVEIRSFVSQEKFNELLDFFGTQGKKVSEDSQETHYFDSKEDLRIQKNNFYSKIWMKKGQLHDDQREEIELKVEKNDFEKLGTIFEAAGLNVQIKWFRTRHTFEWEGITVMLDHTRGYGHILELEKMSDEAQKDETLALLKSKMESLGIAQTPKEVFSEKYNHYKINWRELVKE